MRSLTIVSYFTRHSLYEKDAERLKESCITFDLPHLIEGVEPFGKWHEHICYKPTYILQKLEELKSPILWIDADGEIIQKPTLFTDLSCDMALRFFDTLPNDHPSYLFGATIYIDYNPTTLSLVREWSEGCKRAIRQNPELEVSDQHILQSLLQKRKNELKIKALPPGYAAIFDEAGKLAVQDLFIIQYQASRLYKKFINKEVSSFGIFSSLSIEELRALRPRLHI